MSSRRHILLIGGIYLLAIVGLLGAAWLVVRAIPQAAVVPSLSVAPDNIPTLRPLWPPAARTPSSGQLAWTAGRTLTVPVTLAPGAPPACLPTQGATPILTTGSLLPTGVAVTSTATAIPVTAAVSAHGRVSGRVLLDVDPAPAGLALRLQTQAYDTVAETTVTAAGEYVFANVPDSAEGYDVTFAQDWNGAAYQRDTVATWAWLGPVKVQNGAELRLPDLEISLSGMRPLTPAFATQISAQAIAAGQPISFTWSAYPQAGSYWLDLTSGANNQPVWQSPLLPAISGTWNGLSSGGTPVAPGDYWWSVGTRRDVSPYTLIVYSYLTKFVISAN